MYICIYVSVCIYTHTPKHIKLYTLNRWYLPYDNQPFIKINKALVIFILIFYINNYHFFGAKQFVFYILLNPGKCHPYFTD